MKLRHLALMFLVANAVSAATFSHLAVSLILTLGELSALGAVWLHLPRDDKRT